MAYVMARIYAGPGASKIDEISALTMKELAPKISQEPGLIRYSTIAFSDGRYGSFSAFNSPEAARRSTQIAAEWVKTSDALQGSKLDETMEGEVAYAVQGAADNDKVLYAIARIYKSEASLTDLKAALESEADGMIRSFAGLARYTAAKLTDGRIGIFSAFDSSEHAKQSSEGAKMARAKAGSQLARVLPSDPEVMEGRVLATHRGERRDEPLLRGDATRAGLLVPAVSAQVIVGAGLPSSNSAVWAALASMSGSLTPPAECRSASR